ncbi:MAG: FolB domain-containing protein [Chthoniobacterales bacterium]|nr:FolB domain-containing protein [Chthoniobacterales bacterium]
MLRNLLLDWSGTLVDDLAPVLGATNHVLEAYGRPPLTRDEFRQHFRLPFTDFYREFLPDVPLDELDALFHDRFTGIRDEVVPLPGLREFLDFCREDGRRLFLLSSVKHEHFEAQARKLDLLHYFECPYAGVLDKRAKIGEVLAAHSLDPDETAFVGDMIHDVETARHGGVMSIAVLTGYDPVGKIMPAKPDVVVSSLHELRRLLQHASARNAGDQILIGGLAVTARIGVTDAERSKAQRLEVDVRMDADFAGVGDDVGRTTDYAAVAAWVAAVCAAREFRLLETLAEDLASGLLAEFPLVSAVEIELRKFVLPDARHAAVRVRRQRDSREP